MVQYTKILVAAAVAVAVAVPALAAPFPNFESREIENIDAREPHFGRVVAYKAARRVMVTNPIKKIADNAKDSYNSQQKQTRPLGPVLRAAVTEQQNQKKASINKVVSDEASRRLTVTNPMKTFNNAGVSSHNSQTRPLGPVLKATVTTQQNQQKASSDSESSHHKRNLEDLLERDLFDLD